MYVNNITYIIYNMYTFAVYVGWLKIKIIHNFKSVIMDSCI